MCGICGLLTGTQRVDMPLLRVMTGSLQHRGPDEEAFYVGRNIGLGFRRLAIVERGAAHQPFQNEGGHIRVVFNGEIYNYKSLKESLGKRGHRFGQGGDGEVIAHLYEEYGFTFPAHLRGTFALALWDGRRRRLLLSRDRLGVKPLYFYLNESRSDLCFASELKALLHGVEDPQVDLEALDQYLSYRYVPAPYTLFRHIRKLEPGTSLIVGWRGERLDARRVRYWRLPEESLALSMSEAVQRVDEALNDAWQIRWPEEVPAGYFFSGGLDSAGLAALHQKSRAEPARTYAVGFEQPEKTRDYRYFSELEQARAAAKLLGTVHRERLVTRREVEERLAEVILAMDEPIADPTALPLYFLAEFAAAAGEKVIFSGEGADELFGGYTVYREPLQCRRYRALPGWLRACAEGAFPAQTRRFSLSLPERYFGVGGLLRPDHKEGLYRPDVWAELRVKSFHGLEELGDEHWPEEQRMLRFDMLSWLPENTLMKSDKVTMAHSLEIRLPYLDHHLVELGVALPLNFKVSHRESKTVLRQALRAYLPREIWQRPKNGFPVPVTAWMQGEWREKMLEVILDPAAGIGRYFRWDALAERFTGPLSSRSARLMWALYTLEVYLGYIRSEIRGRRGIPSSERRKAEGDRGESMLSTPLRWV